MTVPIWTKPFEVPGAALVITRRTSVVDTGSKLIVVGWSDVVAQVTTWWPAGAKRWPSQYSTETAAGNVRPEAR